MKKNIEIIAFPFTLDKASITEPLLALFSHMEKTQDEYIEVFFIHSSNGIKCFLRIEDVYFNKAVSIFSSYRFIVTSIDDIIAVDEMDCSIVMHRKARLLYQESKTISDFSLINASINSPTLSYLLSNSKIGSGIAFVLGRLQDEPQNDPLRFIKDSFKSRELEIPKALEGVISSSQIYIACAFLVGDEETQIDLADEMCYSVPGWDYSFLSKTINLLDNTIEENMDNLFSSDSMFREGRYSIKDRRQLPLLRFVSEDEFCSIVSTFNNILSEDTVTPNLYTLWNSDATRFFKEEDNSVCIGSSLYDEQEYHLARQKLRQGLLIVGSSGSGKGNQLFRIIEQLKDVPMLIFESAKQEMHHLQKVIPQLQTWRPIAGQFLLNPFEIPEELTLSEYRASLIQILRTCFRLDGPLEELFISTLNRCFYKAKYTDSSKSNDPFVLKWGLHEFIIEYSRMINESGYSPKTKDDMKQAGLTRLKALLDSNPDVYDTDHSINLVDLIKKESVNLIQLNSLPTIEAKQSLATMLLISLGTYMQLRFQHCEDQNKLRLLIVMDESHNLLKSVNDINGVSYSFADDFANLMLTLRSVGVGFIVSDQTTANIPNVIADACDSKMFMGSSRFSGIADYLDFLGADDELLKNLYRLEKGSGVLSFSGAPHGVVFKTPNYIDTFSLSERVEINNAFIHLTESQKAASFFECQFCPDYLDEAKCCLKSKQQARQIVQEFIFREGNPYEWNYYNRDNEKVDFFKQSRKRKMFLVTKELNKRFKCRNYCSFIQWLRTCNLLYETSFKPDDIDFIIKNLYVGSE